MGINFFQVVVGSTWGNIIMNGSITTLSRVPDERYIFILFCVYLIFIFQKYVEQPLMWSQKVVMALLDIS